MEKVEKNGRGNREGFLRLMLCDPPGTLQDHVERTVLGRRRDLRKLKHLVYGTNCTDVLGKAPLGLDLARTNQPDGKETDNVVLYQKIYDVSEHTELLESFPLRGDRLECVGRPSVLLNEGHARCQLVVES